MDDNRSGGVGRYLDEARVGREHLKLLGLVGGGGFFDGFDIYLAGSVLATMVATKFSTVGQNATFLSITFAGLLIGSLLAGRLGDRFGRRTTYLYALLLYGVTTIVTAFAATPGEVIALRGIGGLGLGAVIVSSYGMWTEFLPRKSRGTWAGVLAMIINLSQPASALAALLAIPHYGWRSMFLIAGIPAIVIWALQVRYLCESPRWLESRGRVEEALRIARTFNPSGVPADSEHAAAASAGSRVETRVSVRDLFRGRLLRVTLLGVLVMVCSQVPYYSFQAWVPTYLVHQGFSVAHTLTFTFLMQLGAIPGNLLGGLLGDRFGRKWTNVAVFVLLGLLGIAYGSSGNAVELVVLGFLWIVLANFMIANTIATYVPEIFPTPVRLQGSALANAAGRAGTILSPFMVAWLFASSGVAAVFASSLVIFVIGAAAIAVLGGETRRKGLEEIAEEELGSVETVQGGEIHAV